MAADTNERTDMSNLETLLEKHRPRPGQEGEPCGTGQLWHLNNNGLIGTALEAEVGKAAARPDAANLAARYVGVVISKQTAWEILADAQRGGLQLTVHRPLQ